jgi:hypothetical protein
MSEPRPTSNVRRVDFGKAGDKAVAASGRRASAGGGRLVNHPSRMDPDQAAEPVVAADPARIPAPSASVDGSREPAARPRRKVVSLPSGERGPRSTAYGRQNGVLVLAVVLAAILGATLAAILLDPGL